MGMMRDDETIVGGSMISKRHSNGAHLVFCI